MGIVASSFTRSEPVKSINPLVTVKDKVYSNTSRTEDDLKGTSDYSVFLLTSGMWTFNEQRV